MKAKNEHKASEFLAKARKLIRWSNITLADLEEHGKAVRIDDIERSFFSILCQLSSVHEAIASSASLIGLHVWRSEFNNIRLQDQLLSYLWKARDSDTHNSPIKWQPTLTELTLKIVDLEKERRIGKQFYFEYNFMRVWEYVYGVRSELEIMRMFDLGRIPKKERLDEAGVVLISSIHSLRLTPFNCRVGGKFKLFEPPMTHLNNANSPIATESVRRAIDFYTMKLNELIQNLTLESQQPGGGQL